MTAIEPPERDADYRVPALQRGLTILGMFTARERTPSICDIAERLGVSPSAVYRIVQTLVDMDRLQKSGCNAFELRPPGDPRRFFLSGQPRHRRSGHALSQ